MIQTFKDLVDQFTPASDTLTGLLPFCHVTREGFATDIIENKSAKPMPCLVYDEQLLYFFYGKANYVIDAKKLASYTDDPPICFIFDSVKITQAIKRILPFDSGGYPRYDIREGFLKERFAYEKKPDLKHLPSLKHILGYIKLIYNTHKRYMDNEVDMENLEKLKDDCVSLNEYIVMLDKAAKGKLADAGPQVFSIEVQYDTDIAFEPSHIVIPFMYYTKPWWSKHFKESFPNIKLEHYAEKEQLGTKGLPLTSADFHRLMRAKVDEVIAANFLKS